MCACRVFVYLLICFLCECPFVCVSFFIRVCFVLFCMCALIRVWIWLVAFGLCVFGSFLLWLALFHCLCLFTSLRVFGLCTCLNVGVCNCLSVSLCAELVYV